jgi:GNAT superfamily N-acetyltransferase
MLQIREAQREDAPFLQELYRYHLSACPPKQAEPLAEWERMLERFSQDESYHLLVGTIEGRPVCSVTLIVIPNLTHGRRPYALIENVVTHAAYRGRGYAGALMEHARMLAKQAGCYKLMLLTGSKKPETLRFYERCGFNRQEKTGFYMAL